MNSKIRIGLLIGVFGLLCIPAFSADTGSNPFIGRWALTVPGGAGWLCVSEEKDGKGNPYLDAEILWIGGSVVPVSSVTLMKDPNSDNQSLMITRIFEVERKDAQGKVYRKQQYTDSLWGRIEGDELQLRHFVSNPNGLGFEQQGEATGKRIPDVPAKPDLSNVKYGEPVTLFNGKDLTGWKLTDEKQVNGWFVQDGILVNDPKQEKGKPHIPYGNLRTEKEFEDFNLTLEVCVLPEGNSGIYMRGIYEVQVADTFGKPLDSHNMGGIYSRITPSTNAEKKAGEWQTYDITLCDRHATVILNGVKIVDNEPLLGCTGGALSSDEFRPGPIYLQGDHTGVKYRNIVLKPIVK